MASIRAPSSRYQPSNFILPVVRSIEWIWKSKVERKGMVKGILIFRAKLRFGLYRFFRVCLMGCAIARNGKGVVNGARTWEIF